MFDPKQAHVEQIASGRWAIFNPDGSRFDIDGTTYATYAAARRALLFFQT